MYNVAYVNDDSCVAEKGCRLCIMYCPEANCLDLNTVKMVAEVNISRCKGCELCLSACPHHCLELDLGAVNPLGYHPVRLTDASACTSCAICARVCPDAVFTVFALPKAVVR